MVVQVDTREKQRAIKQILKTFDRRGVKHISSKLFVGDYMAIDNPRVVVDRKQNLIELCTNVCQDHDRFRAELIRARDVGIKVVILVEHGDGIKSLEDVIFWRNPRLDTSPKALTGERLYKILRTIGRKYGCLFDFCDKRETGDRILEWLESGADDGIL